jgi:hypothetical protein
MTIKEFLEDAAARLDFEASDNLPPKAVLLDALFALYDADEEMRLNDLLEWAFGASGYYEENEIRAFCYGVDRGRKTAEAKTRKKKEGQG